MNEIDSPDFGKARGLLIGFSSIALVLWFYGVDLTTIKFLGLEIVPKRNAIHSWGLMALVNLYLCFRFYQRIPENKCYFDDRMNAIYDEALGWLALVLYRREVKRECPRRLSKVYSTVSFSGFDVVSYKYAVACHGKLNSPKSRSGGDESVPLLWNLSRADRTSLNLKCSIKGKMEDKPKELLMEMEFPKTMPAVLTWMCKAFAMFRGMFVTPWFTDNWFPLGLGSAAVGVALHRWLVINVM
ncbi:MULTISPECIES: hypothetical protein [unclassified Pseudomonas]|uniref:hypothetical protein n=1 Tax=unclassified Pseudomonas TaxID=196821 RepID=UPI00224AB26B|nr:MULTISPECIES: hypothetical protein [unclassified Pseudomonas]MCX2814579.1 hypothetical protein [Pseudomonas sp. DCB_E]MCX9143940.1 hypothetical protein [Pseudomonas sp. DCB_Q]